MPPQKLFFKELTNRNVNDLLLKVDDLFKGEFRDKKVKNIIDLLKEEINFYNKWLGVFYESENQLQLHEQFTELNSGINSLFEIISWVEIGQYSERIKREADILIWFMLRNIKNTYFITSSLNNYSYNPLLKNFRETITYPRRKYYELQDKTKLSELKVDNLDELVSARGEIEQPSELEKYDLHYFQIPSKDSQYVLNWVFLFHEIGHSLLSNKFKNKVTPIYQKKLEKNKNAKKLIEEYRGTTGSDILARWINEVLSDIFSLLVAGPAYVNAFILDNILYNQFEVDKNFGHPPPGLRICILLELYKKLGSMNKVNWSKEKWLYRCEKFHQIKKKKEQNFIDYALEICKTESKYSKYIPFYNILFDSRDQFLKKWEEEIEYRKLPKYDPNIFKDDKSLEMLLKKLSIAPSSDYNPIYILNAAWQKFIDIEKDEELIEKDKKIEILNSLTRKSILGWHLKDDWIKHK